jgi:magnesium transporter
MRSKNVLPPESLIYTGTKSVKTDIHHLQYDAKSIRETRTVDVHPTLNDWIIITGLTDTELIQKICSRFDVDTLVIEDILNVYQRNKVEVYPNYVFSVKKFAYLENDEIKHEYISILLFEDKLIMFQEDASPIFEPVVQRIKQKQGIITKMKHDYLYYVILDTMVDNNISVRKHISQRIMMLETDMMNFDTTKQAELYKLRKELMFLKNSNKQLLFSFAHKEYVKIELIKDRVYKYYDDLYDHIARLDENISIEQELLSNLLDVHMNNVSNKTNRIMTVLTIFSAIFIPLSFLAGVFGMNFIAFPFLQNENGILIFILICAFISISMLGYFKYRKWI